LPEGWRLCLQRWTKSGSVHHMRYGWKYLFLLIQINDVYLNFKKFSFVNLIKYVIFIIWRWLLQHEMERTQTSKCWVLKEFQKWIICLRDFSTLPLYKF
jgi:hypothetical protein